MKLKFPKNSIISVTEIEHAKKTIPIHSVKLQSLIPSKILSFIAETDKISEDKSDNQNLFCFQAMPRTASLSLSSFPSFTADNPSLPPPQRQHRLLKRHNSNTSTGSFSQVTNNQLFRTTGGSVATSQLTRYILFTCSSV